MLSRLVIVFLPRTMRSLSDLIHHTRRKSGHSDQEATVMAPLAHVHFQNTGCQACLCSLTFIITLWGKQSSSSYLTHKEIETVSGLGNGRQNCKAVKSTSHGIGWMWVGFRLCCLLAVWLWVMLQSMGSQTVRHDWASELSQLFGEMSHGPQFECFIFLMIRLEFYEFGGRLSREWSTLGLLILQIY